MKKVKYIALALVLCLGLIGGAYALGWTDAVQVNAEVETGHVDVYWDVFEIRDQEIDDPWNPGDSFPLPPYMVASAWIDSQDNKLAHLYIGNLYPIGDDEEMVAVEAHIKNDSSIGVKLDSIDLVFQNGSEYASDIKVKYTLGIMTPHVPGPGYDWVAITPYPVYQETTLENLGTALMGWLENEVLEPCQLFTFGENTLYFYLEGADAPQNANVQFTLKFNFKQFNQ